jgi:hypothetical protein
VAVARTDRGLGQVGALVLACSAVALVAHADPSFGPHDVRTIFYISKSDDRNRVDYGVRLDAACLPVGSEPVYAYWHRFEPGQPRYGDLNLMDRRAYAISSQAVRSTAPEGSWIELRLAALPGERVLVLVQRAGEGCIARARFDIRGRPAFLDHIHVTLRGPLAIDHVTLRGEDVSSGTPVFEHRTP